MATSSQQGQRDSYRQLAAESAALREQLEKLAGVLEQATKTEGGEAMKTVSNKARGLLSRATAVVDDVIECADKGVSIAVEGRGHLEDKVRRQPLLALAIAATAGFLLASLRRR
jgi:ElaB/YqjD/DUF883 family membrane-anchored ribosome-binding protein